MKLLMTLLVRDEQDIIRENIEFHRSQGVDFFIVTDNRSVDRTTEILKNYARLGVLHYLREDGDDYSQQTWVSRMARLASTEYGADWVINNDADEFWWPLYGNLKSTFENIPSRYNVLVAKRHNFVPVTNQNAPFYASMIFRQAVSLNSLGRHLPPKMAHRGEPDIVVTQGNHHVEGIGNLYAAENLIEIFHYPIRTYEQIANKIAKGGAAYERNAFLPDSVGKTWRVLYGDYKKNDGLHDYYADQIYDDGRINREIETGQLIVDRRLLQYLITDHTCRQNLAIP